ncbi:rhomboid family intramembrane serine protease [Mucilaginibacter sp. UR6-1]|uniref:rhomboid family intramembrane serine protease n=1 Tax=Mucilaginibacter sp. UR6-1 TaxID=1435643 RepID=UPI001E428FE6|nr:rhomboid family intramembrane serine protease [Mucilaginibacter sp. UR6-1]MCC8410351.1 rhomboid family intramembrane serine protease [Mucilaginibacter sp. UR6-1]
MKEYIEMAPVASMIFIITLVTSLYAFSNETVYRKFTLHPYSVSRGRELYTLITSGLIHKDWGHLFFNMLSFFFFAFTLEATVGHWQFGLIYLVSLVLSDLPTVAKHRHNQWYYSLGASGAISAVVFSFILFYPKAGMYLMMIPISIPAYIFGILYLVYCTYSSRYAQDGINHDAHFYGALSGILLTIMVYPQVIKLFLAAFGISV